MPAKTLWSTARQEGACCPTVVSKAVPVPSDAGHHRSWQLLPVGRQLVSSTAASPAPGCAVLIQGWSCTVMVSTEVGVGF